MITDERLAGGIRWEDIRQEDIDNLVVEVMDTRQFQKKLADALSMEGAKSYRPFDRQLILARVESVLKDLRLVPRRGAAVVDNGIAQAEATRTEISHALADVMFEEFEELCDMAKETVGIVGHEYIRMLKRESNRFRWLQNLYRHHQKNGQMRAWPTAAHSILEFDALKACMDCEPVDYLGVVDRKVTISEEGFLGIDESSSKEPCVDKQVKQASKGERVWAVSFQTTPDRFIPEGTTDFACVWSKTAEYAQAFTFDEALKACNGLPGRFVVQHPKHRVKESPVDRVLVEDAAIKLAEAEYIKDPIEKGAVKAQIVANAIDHPKHYNSLGATCSACGHPIECIDIVRCMSFNLGNAVKYLWRAGHKGDALEDIKKARWYLDDEIKQREGMAR